MSKIRITASAVAVLLAGCGGGSDEPPKQQTPPPSAPPAAVAIPDGLYVGTTNTGRAVTGLVLDDGSYYVLYSAANNPGVIAGAVQGTGKASSTHFDSLDGRDINLEGLGVVSTTVAPAYTAKTSLVGTIAYQSLNQVVTFTAIVSREVVYEDGAEFSAKA